MFYPAIKAGKLVIAFVLLLGVPIISSGTQQTANTMNISQYLDAVILLFLEDERSAVPPDKKIALEGTGFLYGYPSGNQTGTGLRPWLVTCKHVVEKARELMKSGHFDFRVRFKRGNNQQTFSLPIQEQNNFRWTYHPTEDVAVIQASVQNLEQHKVDWRVFVFPHGALTRTQVQENNISEGHTVLSFGFPLGWKGGKEGLPLQDHAIVRHGVLAQVQGWIRQQHTTFLIDGSIFPGNSGGPVGVFWPQPFSGFRLVGMVSGTMQGSENLGLGVIIPVEAINDTIERAMQQERKDNK